MKQEGEKMTQFKREKGGFKKEKPIMAEGVIRGEKKKILRFGIRDRQKEEKNEIDE